MTTQDQLDNFHRFACEQISHGGSQASLDELYSRWRIDNPTQDERDEVNEIIRQGIEDIAAGRGRDAQEVTEELRKKHGIASE
jgi:hypothetical protein